MTTTSKPNTFSVKAINRISRTEYVIEGAPDLVQVEIDKIFHDYPANPYFTTIDADFLKEAGLRYVIINRSNTSD